MIVTVAFSHKPSRRPSHLPSAGSLRGDRHSRPKPSWRKSLLPATRSLRGDSHRPHPVLNRGTSDLKSFQSEELSSQINRQWRGELKLKVETASQQAPRFFKPQSTRSQTWGCSNLKTIQFNPQASRSNEPGSPPSTPHLTSAPPPPVPHPSALTTLFWLCLIFSHTQTNKKSAARTVC